MLAMVTMVEMKVNSESSPNHGKHMVVELGPAGWNPETDQPDSRYVTGWLIENGQKGSISLEYLIFPLPCDKQWDGVPFE